MMYLFVTSLIWAFSFGLIKNRLAGLDPSFVAFARLSLAFIAFAPLLRLKQLKAAVTLRLLGIGAVQYGLMYVAYIHAFRFLAAHEVALFTVFTPLFVTLIDDAFKKELSSKTFFAVLLAVAGGGIIKYHGLESGALWRGLLYVQAANLCFAFGQVAYRRVMPATQTDRSVFALLYCGAMLTTALFAAPQLGRITLSANEGITLLYLGLAASGLGFFLWNAGARRVSAGVLAIFNNLKIPLAILVSVLVFRESTDWIRLFAGGSLMVSALYINRKTSGCERKSNKPEIPV